MTEEITINNKVNSPNWKKALPFLLHFSLTTIKSSGHVKQVIMAIEQLSSEDLREYENAILEKNSAFSLVKESFSLTFKTIRGINDDDVEKLEKRTSDPYLKKLLSEVCLVGDANTILTLDRPNAEHFEKGLTYYAKRSDGKYDLLIVSAKQVKTLDYNKLATAGISSVVIGFLVAAGIAIAGVTTGGAALVIGGAVAATGAVTTGIKASNDYKRAMNDVITGFIVHDLIRQNVLKLENNKVYLAAN